MEHLLVSDDEFNNQRSFITYNDSFNLQIEDTLITRQFALSHMATTLTRKFLLITSQMYRSFKRSALDELVVEMNELIYNKMRTFDQLCNSDGSFIDENITDRAQEFMLRMELFSKSYTLYYILFLTADFSLT